MLERAPGSPRSSRGQIGATTDDRRARVVIVGGGIAGVEGLLGLHELAGDRVDLTLISPEPGLTYKPLLVEELFFSTPAPRHDLAELCDQLGARFVHQAVIGLHAAEKFVALADGSELAYDLLVICVGACCRPAYTNAITFPSPEPRLRVEDLIGAAGDATGRIAFVVPPGRAGHCRSTSWRC